MVSYNIGKIERTPKHRLCHCLPTEHSTIKTIITVNSQETEHTKSKYTNRTTRVLLVDNSIASICEFSYRTSTMQYYTCSNSTKLHRDLVNFAMAAILKLGLKE